MSEVSIMKKRSSLIIITEMCQNTWLLDGIDHQRLFSCVKTTIPKLISGAWDASFVSLLTCGIILRTIPTEDMYSKVPLVILYLQMTQNMPEMPINFD